MAYKYKTIEKKSSNLEDLLNELGEDGWELCGIFAEYIFIFKKQI